MLAIYFILQSNVCRTSMNISWTLVLFVVICSSSLIITFPDRLSLYKQVYQTSNQWERPEFLSLGNTVVSFKQVLSVSRGCPPSSCQPSFVFPSHFFTHLAKSHPHLELLWLCALRAILLSLQYQWHWVFLGILYTVTSCAGLAKYPPSLDFL